MNFKPLQTMAGVHFYFDWAAFHSYDLICHIIETNETFDMTIREYIIEFRGEKHRFLHKVPEGCARKEIPYYRLRVRAWSMRTAMRHGGHLWDEILIGFQAKGKITTDIYHAKVLHHFQ